MASFFCCAISKIIIYSMKLVFASSLLLLLLQVSNCKHTYNTIKSTQLCASFHLEPSAQGTFFLLNNRDQSTNLGEDQRAFGTETTGWKGSVLITVEKGCHVNVCDDILFGGNCHTLTQGFHSATDEGKSFLSNILSTKCTCRVKESEEIKYQQRLFWKMARGGMEPKYRKKRDSEAQRQGAEQEIQQTEEDQRSLGEFGHKMSTAFDRKQPGGGSGGCLKSGTKILTEDRSEITVESLKVGDVILDKDFQPTIVLGVAREFLLDQTFYGFHHNDSFFTGNHLFVGPSNRTEDEIMKLYAKLPSQLYKNNPLMAYLNVTEMKKGESVDLYKIRREPNNQLAVTSTRIDKVYQDSQNYPEETVMYDIMVDSPSGTYIANGYVCKHELPPLDHWPNTMSLLFRLMGTPIFQEKLPLLPFSVEKVKMLHEIADDIAGVAKDFISENSLKEFRKLEEQHHGASNPLMTLADVNSEECLSRIFENPIISAAGLRLYSRVGPVIAPILDNTNGEIDLTDKLVATLQHELFNIINFEMEKGFSGAI